MPFTNYWLVSLVFWPAAVLVAALADMAIWAEFSITELLVDYVIGFAIGSFFFLFTDAEPDDRSWWRSLLMVWSQGIFGLLGMTSLFPSTATLFWWSAGSMIGSTTLCAALDHAAVGIGGTMTAGGVVLSVLLFLLKAPFSLISTGVGLLIWIAGLCHSGAANAGAGFLAGVTYEEWNRTAPKSGTLATTVGATVHCWKRPFGETMKHELNHSRQYIYMHDWLIPAWAICWAVTGGKAGKENPIENVAYGIQTP
jgi:hypothetical protein